MEGLRLYCDPRVGGQPRYILSEEPPITMMIPDLVRKCVMFIGWRRSENADDIRWAGTGFIVSTPLGVDNLDYMSLVTARHCIEEIAKRSVDGKVYVRINLKEGRAIVGESATGDWKFHPTDSSADVAAVPLAIDWPLVDHFGVPQSALCDKETLDRFQIGCGDEVFITGLFRETPGTAKATPIIRIGNIAAMPEERVWTDRYGEIDAVLIEARSIGGLSGSPVFVTIDPFAQLQPGQAFVKSGTARPTRGFRLLGLIHGHWDSGVNIDSDTADIDSPLRVNMGIAIVIPAIKVAETLEHPALQAGRQAARIAAERRRPSPTADFGEP